MCGFFLFGSYLVCCVLAVTTDYLAAISGDATEEEETTVETKHEDDAATGSRIESAEPPPRKMIKLETETPAEPPEPAERITLENGLVFGVCE